MNKIVETHTLVDGASRIVTVAHTHPDGDALGSGLALTGYLQRLGKDAALVVPDRVPDSLGFIAEGLPGGSLIVFDDDPDAASRILGSDLVFCLDCSGFSRTNPEMEKALKASAAPKILIDHHLNPDLEDFDIAFSRTDVSSTCEILLGILRDMPGVDGDLKALPEVSLNALLTGITTDTNNFANSVFPGTLNSVSDLMAAGADRDRILSELYFRYRENRLRLMGFMLHENMETLPGGVALMILDKGIQDRYDFREGESEGFVNLPLSVEDIKMSVFLTEEREKFRVSVRSKPGVSANRFAMKYFHGGGHEMAAGGRLYFPEDIPDPGAAKAYILKVTREFFGI